MSIEAGYSEKRREYLPNYKKCRKIPNFQNPKYTTYARVRNIIKYYSFIKERGKGIKRENPGVADARVALHGGEE